ncbi:hypothetical protein [Methylobacterium sp. Leaf117]|uniref:hypothetical protein n=1 Tax=Methylobacterium sp. Leaf117 TaxID=1736260 RepID=UPI0006F95D0C|nr:hypothetical protein [Methylobacterium sp. Leaf117]KQP91664.1 hypothetical protein ASF57_03820 [Methylobacterium sp. Leaf117]
MRAYTATIAGASPARHSSGAVRLATTVTTYEFYDDGPTGTFAGDGRPIRSIRKSERKTLGWLVLSGGRVRFVARLVIAESWISATAAQYGGKSNQWQLVKAGGGGGWAQNQETNLEDTGWRTRLLTPDGLVASDANAQIIHADSTGATVLTPPPVVANNFARAFPIPGLGAIIVPTSDGSAARAGQAYVSLDGGVTWKGPAKTYTASASFPTAQLNDVSDYALLPLYPS